MSKPKECIQCGKPATIHLTQIIDDEVHKIDMCEDCAHGKGLSDVDGFTFPEVEKKVISEKTLPTCDLCGTTFEDYKKTGRLGSPECYVVFRNQLEPLLKKMHRSIVHMGKVPKLFGETNLTFLNDRLRQAIDVEHYEEAANIRDKIKLLQNND
jgi:protein arginine kinase activator